MGKSFNDDVFNNGFNLDSINGLNISKEAIAENKQNNKEIDKIEINHDDLKKAMEEVKESKKKIKKSEEENLEELIKEQKRLNEKLKEYDSIKKEHEDIYIKKTMIFKKEYIDIIDGLATIKDMQIKDVLNQLLETGINKLDSKTRERAQKTGEKNKSSKNNKAKQLF